jgi:hypothetical protein
MSTPQEKLDVFLSRKAGGRGQEAGGKLRSAYCRDLMEQGFKTPTELSFSGSKSVGDSTPTDLLLLPPASCLLPPASFNSQSLIPVKLIGLSL